MNATTYQLRGVAKAYGGRQVLHIPYLDIFPGEILAVVGPSGSGKSTLLRLLNFLEPPTSGTVVFAGSTFGSDHGVPLELRRRVTTVFQHPMLLNRTVWDNVRYGLRLRGERDGTALVESALARVGLQQLARQPARTLSGGEAQRVALARAMVLQPEVLLLDEPTANLDPYNVALIEDTVQQLRHERGTTMVLVTHNIFQARRLAQRVVFLLNGGVVEVAEATAFFSMPSDPRTAAFVRGDMVY